MKQQTRILTLAAALVLSAAFTAQSVYGDTAGPGTIIVNQGSPAAASSGAPSTPPSGNYPGSGSSPQHGVVPPTVAPSGPTPGSGNTGFKTTPPSGVVPGSGASVNTNH